MRLRLNALVERIRASLFFLPMAAVVVAMAAGGFMLAVDRHLGDQAGDLPLGLVSTVDGARELLSTIAGATISFAGIAFSVSLLIIQQASSQYSPRVVHTLFRDPFNKRVMGLVVGTFTFCLVVLRSVRGPLEEGGAPIVPSVSVAVAVVLGIATILAIVAFINHSAHSMDVSEILDRIRVDAIHAVEETWRVHDAGRPGPDDTAAGPSAVHSVVIRFTRTGWIQQIDFDALLETIERGSTLRLDTASGRYAIAGTVLGRVEPPPSDPEVVERAVNAALDTGTTRTMQQDAAYGLRQLADVALKALSPGINDPTTAQDAIFHSGAVLGEMLRRDPPQPTITGRDGRRLIVAPQSTPEGLVHLAFAETRRAASPHPAVCIYLLEALERIAESLEARGLGERAVPLAQEAALVLEGCRAEGLLPADLLEIEHVYRQRFADAS